jgi:ubiquinone/menaquinone biosynthesis C-methylase UbiE
MTEIDVGSLLEMLYAYQSAAILMASSELGVYDALAEAPLTSEELAMRLRTPPRSTQLLLNACVAVGLVQKSDVRYENSPLANEFLVQGSPRYLGRVVAKEREFYAPWGNLAAAVRSDEAQLPPMAQRLQEQPAIARNFLLALHDLALLNGSALPDCVDLAGRKRLLDVGGGVGTYSILLAQRNPDLQAVVLDLPAVRHLAEETIASYGLSERISFEEGDYTAPSLGDGYDVVLLANVLHDNTQEACLDLLRKAYRALVEGGLIIVNEFHLDADKVNPPVSAIFSLLMMLENQGAAEYPAQTIVDWLLEAGFSRPEIHRLPEPSPMVVLAATKS